MFNSFLVRNFRTFRELSIPRFGRVNLIVGKNAVGKTTLLEALWLYAAGMRQEAIHEVLFQREEMLSEEHPDARQVEVNLEALFPDSTSDLASEIVIGPIDEPPGQIHVRFVWLERIEESDGRYSLDEIDEQDVSTGTAEGEVYRALKIMPPNEPPFYARAGGRWGRTFRYSRVRRTESFPPFLRAAHVDDDALGHWWDSIALTESEDRIISFLNLLVPVERITPVGTRTRAPGRIFLVRLRDRKTPQPLKSLGDGVERMFRTVLALEYARRGIEEAHPELARPSLMEAPVARNVLLVDEVATGIHYSAHAEYWAMIFRLARELHVQVFATTHSSDCLRGFAEAVAEDDEADGLVVRLERDEGEVATRAIVIDRKKLPIIARDAIEVR
jgi:energy-coupling factor transporter ATP-binding protein EcfA2